MRAREARIEAVHKARVAEREVAQAGYEQAQAMRDAVDGINTLSGHPTHSPHIDSPVEKLRHRAVTTAAHARRMIAKVRNELPKPPNDLLHKLAVARDETVAELKWDPSKGRLVPAGKKAQEAEARKISNEGVDANADSGPDKPVATPADAVMTSTAVAATTQPAVAAAAQHVKGVSQDIVHSLTSSHLATPLGAAGHTWEDVTSLELPAADHKGVANPDAIGVSDASVNAVIEVEQGAGWIAPSSSHSILEHAKQLAEKHANCVAIAVNPTFGVMFLNDEALDATGAPRSIAYQPLLKQLCDPKKRRYQVKDKFNEQIPNGHDKAMYYGCKELPENTDVSQWKIFVKNSFERHEVDEEEKNTPHKYTQPTTFKGAAEEQAKEATAVAWKAEGLRRNALRVKKKPKEASVADKLAQAKKLRDAAAAEKNRALHMMNTAKAITEAASDRIDAAATAHHGN